jgi:hypothetical protein
MIYRQFKSRTKFVIFAVALLLLLINALVILLNLSARTGPFGIGLPAPMANFMGEHIHISINYPDSWVAGETPQGIRGGDDEVVAGFFVPWHSFPHVIIASKTFPQDEIDQVLSWGETRAKRKYPNYTQLDLNTFSTKYNDGWYREYSGTSDSLIFGLDVILCRDYYLLNKSIGYVFTFCSTEKDWPRVEKVAEEMIDSLSFLP